MPDFYAPAGAAPQDQADGLRRLFAGRRTQLLPLVANPHVVFSGLVLDRIAAGLAAWGRRVLVVDAGATSPPPHELSQVDLSACMEMIGPRTLYLPARGLPMQYVDTRGCASRFIDILQSIAPQVDVILLHAEAQDLARVLKRRAERPILLAADQPDSLKHAYASCKLLVQRCGLMTYDLLLTASADSPRCHTIVSSLSGCADQFLQAVVQHHALVDPAFDPAEPLDDALTALLHAQLSPQEVPGHRTAAPGLRPDVGQHFAAEATEAWAEDSADASLYGDMPVSRSPSPSPMTLNRTAFLI
jgi:flagellar biosynthesis protein FlhG